MAEPAGPRAAPTWVLTRFVVLRLLGVVYVCAFATHAFQGLPLFGHDGLTPADRYLDAFAAARGGTAAAARELPTLFWLGISDGLIRGLAFTGMALGALCAAGLANSVTLLALWALQLSFNHIGQTWTGYGWEMQLAETGFLAVFLAAPLDPRPFPRHAPPAPVLLLFRWLIARIMLGAGLIKLRGDACWRELTCLDFHYETQPVPNPLSHLFHALPHALHAAGVLFNHLCELILPVFLFLPRRFRLAAALLMALFQLMLILSGNLSYLNWLTLIPVLACLDDSLWRRVLPRALVARAAAALPARLPARVTAWVLAALVAFMSIDVVGNLFARHQRMNASFQALELVNTYGAFGSVGRVRDEVVLEGTLDGESWVPYELPCKPGDPERRPCIVSPYHRRLDWQLWFAAMGTVDDEPWIIPLVEKLLQADPATLSLFAADPFAGQRPRSVRAMLYRYQLAPPGAGPWWRRRLLGPWLAPLTLDDFR